jgi:hypothetical protein
MEKNICSKALPRDRNCLKYQIDAEYDTCNEEPNARCTARKAEKRWLHRRQG